MLKKVLLINVLFLIMADLLLAQTTGDFVKSEMQAAGKKYILQNLVYPRTMRETGKQGFTVIQATLSESGMTDSLDIVQAISKESAQNAVNTLVTIGNMWTPTQADGKNIRYRYKVVFLYTLNAASNPKTDAMNLKVLAERKMKKNKLEEALKLMEKAIALNPYDSVLYQAKSQIYT